MSAPRITRAAGVAGFVALEPSAGAAADSVWSGGGPSDFHREGEIDWPVKRAPLVPDQQLADEQIVLQQQP